MKKFNVRIFYSSFCAYEVEAENENEAILKARELKINNDEIISNLESFKDADETVERDKNEC